ncbi:hypothetical protein OIU81_37290 (plasmid) [Streptomyces sp. NBC_01454]
MAVSHDGLLGYVTCDGDGSVAVIDLASNEITDTVPGSTRRPGW